MRGRYRKRVWLDAKTKFPQLSAFFGGYFYEDWVVEWDSDEGLLEAVLPRERRPRLEAVLRELERLLALGLTEAELQARLEKECGAVLYPERKGMSYTEYTRWLAGALGEWLRSGNFIWKAPGEK